ncbi:hypothetical protein ACFJIV_29125 [Mucilaginibacter sp. UC70_90]
MVPPLKDLDPDGLAIKQGLPAWKQEHRPQGEPELISLERRQEKKNKIKF